MDFLWSDMLLTLLAVALAVLYAVVAGGQKFKAKKVKRDYKKEWMEL